MKYLYSIFIVLFMGISSYAQQSESQSLDSLWQAVSELSTQAKTTIADKKDHTIWKDRAKYFNLGYVKQTLADKTYGGEIESDFGASLSWGKTFYLHKKPLAGIMKFGIDWSWLDINYAKSSMEILDVEEADFYKSDVHQAEFAMQLGPSFTVNPIHQLKIGAYFRVAPSYSLLYMDETVHHHYVTFCNVGCTVAWKVISVGVEWRWGTAKYKGLTFDEETDSDDLSMDDVINEMKAPDRKFKTGSTRFYLGFRF